MQLNILRRQFLRRLSQTGLLFAIIPTLLHRRIAGAESKSAPALSQQELDVLADLAHRLVPLLEPSSPVYQSVATAIQNQALQSTGLVEMVSNGIAGLAAKNDKPWLQLTAKQRVAVIQSEYPNQFLALIRWVACEHVLRDTGVWAKLGYQGSSIEYGGYLHRGFDDIDWLPNNRARSGQ